MKTRENIYMSKYTAELGGETKSPISKRQVREGEKGQAAEEMSTRDARQGCYPTFSTSDENSPDLCTLNPQGQPRPQGPLSDGTPQTRSLQSGPGNAT